MSAQIWNLADTLHGSSPDALLEEAKRRVKAFTEQRDRLDDLTPAKVRELFDEREAIVKLTSRATSHYHLKHAEKTDDAAVLAKLSTLDQLTTDLANQTLFFTLWLIALEDEKARALIEAPELQRYRYYIESARKRKPYTKSEEIEQILNLKSITGEGLATLYSIICDSFTFTLQGREGLTKEEVVAARFSSDPQVREASYESLLTPYAEQKAALAELYKQVVLEWDIEGLQIRTYASPISLRNVDNDIPDEVVATLLRVIAEERSVFTEYFRLKHELNQRAGNTYAYSRYHLYAPYTKATSKRYPYEESKRIVLETFGRFDERFAAMAARLFDEQHIHSHPAKGKRSGAFCADVDNETTPYVLLNHTDSLRDVFTMAHELGHAVHDLLASEQPTILMHPALPMAETASIFAEMLLARRLLDESTDETERTSILLYLLDNQYASIVRQGYFVLFEQYAHDALREGATRDELDAKWMELLREQFGDMELPECFKHEWNHIPHIHHTPFYCYAYAWGNLLVLALYDLYRKDANAFKQQYFTLLSTGGSRSPAQILKAIGIDAADERFWRRGFAIIRDEIEELRTLVG